MDAKQRMKANLKRVTAFGCLLPIAFLHSTALNSNSMDFQRLQWLCNDYQLPVEGYVVEGWFQVIHVPGMERFIQEQLEINRGYQQVVLHDGSVVTTDFKRNRNKWQITLQLISKDPIQILQYYSRWQNFSDNYCKNNPVGITVITKLPERLDDSVCNQLIKEIADGLKLQMVSEIATDGYIQHSGYTSQLSHKLEINGEAVNGSITVVPDEDGTYLYIASPVLYQQI